MPKWTTHAVLLLRPINKSTDSFFFLAFSLSIIVVLVPSSQLYHVSQEKLEINVWFARQPHCASLTVHTEQPSITPTHFPVFAFASSLFSSVPSLNSEEANTFVGGGVFITWMVCAGNAGNTLWQKKWSVLKQPGSNKNTHPYKWCNLTLIKCNITKVNTISEKTIWGIS